MDNIIHISVRPETIDEPSVPAEKIFHISLAILDKDVIDKNIDERKKFAEAVRLACEEALKI